MLPSGALPVFPHCPSSVCSRRSATYISSLPQQCSLQQEPFPPAPPLPVTQPPPPFHHPQRPFRSPLPNSPRHHRNPPPAVFFTAAAVPAPTGISSIFPHCPSSDCSRRSTIYFPHCPSSVCSHRSATCISSLPQ